MACLQPARNYYRPQRSWAKVMFLQASVILSTGGVPGLFPGGVPGLVPEGGYLVCSRGGAPGLVPGGVPGLFWGGVWCTWSGPGGFSWQTPPQGPGTHPPGPCTPTHPPRIRYIPQTRYTTPPPRTRYTHSHPKDQVHPPQDQVHPPQDQVHPPRPGTPPNTANERPVRILLECILVSRVIETNTKHLYSPQHEHQACL